MIARLFSAALRGVEAIEVEVEVNARGAEKPLIQIVGLPDAAVREASQRVTSAIGASALFLDDGLKIVNLAPADLKKEGPSFDLPIALSMVAASGTKEFDAEDCCVVGELGLDGAVRPVKGVLSIALEAKRRGRKRILVPEANAAEAAVIDGIDVYPIRNLSQAWRLLSGELQLLPFRLDRRAYFETDNAYDVDFDDVKGQHHVKRALEVAAAGAHCVMLSGAPGTGKSMLAKRLRTILPQMTEEEAIEVTQIHSISGLLDAKRALMVTRPFRSPHHTISDAGLLGGGTHPGPGEISLAHHGVLFLDELPEFRRSTLETMRQPLEDGAVCVARAAGSYVFPSRFMLIAAMNPCPCGYYGDRKRECRCSVRQIENYRQRVSGPLMDRIDIHLDVPIVDFRELSSHEPSGDSSAVIRERVTAARAIQTERFRKDPNATNAAMGARQVRQHCRLDEEAAGYLRHAMEAMHFSARAHDRILKVARTLADLGGSQQIRAQDVLEAIQYRTLDRKLFA